MRSRTETAQDAPRFVVSRTLTERGEVGSCESLAGAESACRMLVEQDGEALPLYILFDGKMVSEVVAGRGVSPVGFRSTDLARRYR